MSYSTLEKSGDDLQRKREQIERKWHFIGRAYVCHKGGSKHEHWSKDEFLSCDREDMKTKRDQEHEKYLKDKDLEIAAEKTKTVETNAKAERDLIEQRRQAKLDINDKTLKLKETELQVGMQQKVNQERRSSDERQAMKMKHDHEIKLKKLEMEQQAKSAKLEERKIKVEENKANNIKDLLAILKQKKQSTNHGAIDSRNSERSQLHLDIDHTTGSIDVSKDAYEVPSAINKLLFN